MLFKKKNTESQTQPERKLIFTFFYWNKDLYEIEEERVEAESENEAIEKFKCLHPYKSDEIVPCGYEFSFKYEYVDQSTGIVYTHFWNESYFNHLLWKQRAYAINSKQSIMDKKSKLKSDLQPLYCKRNGTYQKTGLYIDPSKLK